MDEGRMEGRNAMSKAGAVGTDAVPAEERLAYAGKTFINFRNHTYQWVSIKLFALPNGADDREVLELLLRHVRYRDSYGGTGDRDMETIHGPYLLDAITPESFFPVSAPDAETLIRTWAEYAAPLPDDSRGELEQELYPRIRDATSRYQLPELPDTGRNKAGWGSSVGSATGFFEFVLIDRRCRCVALVVASDD